MFKLIIKHADGTLYWQEHFNTQEECDKWLTEERTRRYWKQEFTWITEEINKKDPVKEAEIKAKREVKEQKRQERITQVKDFDWTKIPNGPEKQLLKLLADDFLKDQD